MWEIRNLERYLGKVEPSLPIATAAKANGFYRLPGKSDRSPVRPDRKRCQERLIKKGKMDKEYLQQVQEELLSSKKLKGMTSFGTQELNDLVRSIYNISNSKEIIIPIVCKRQILTYIC